MKDIVGHKYFSFKPLVFYAFKRMPLGLVNVSATFQRLIELCLGESCLKKFVIYLGDTIVHSKQRRDISPG